MLNQSNAYTHPVLLVPVSHGELLDKISILQIKSERINDSRKLYNVNEELRVLQSVVQTANLPDAALLLLLSLREINSQLWEVEDKIRACEQRLDFGDEFIALARSVYHTNDQRAVLKRQINELTGSTLVEEKSYADY